jgi:hypothetical protein
LPTATSGSVYAFGFMQTLQLACSGEQLYEDKRHHRDSVVFHSLYIIDAKIQIIPKTPAFLFVKVW